MTAGVDLPILVETTRGGHVESVHRGSFVVLDPDGRVSVGVGDLGPVYARSALKPLQAVAMLRAGWPGSVEAVALAAASHNGEAIHTDGVRRTLAGAGLDEGALQCPAAWPAESALADYVARGGGAPASICHNCSGKHAAMTATCVTAGWTVDTYLAPEHPLQMAVAATIAELCGVPIAYSSVDGCGAPAHAVPLPALAAAFGRLARAASGTPEGEVAAAMRAHPQLIGGTGRAVSELMNEVDGLIAKDGADGIWAAALPDGRAFAAKVADGSERALPPLLAAVLLHWGADGSAVRRHAEVPIVGGLAKVRVGEVRRSSELTALLGLPQELDR